MFAFLLMQRYVRGCWWFQCIWQSCSWWKEIWIRSRLGWEVTVPEWFTLQHWGSLSATAHTSVWCDQLVHTVCVFTRCPQTMGFVLNVGQQNPSYVKAGRRQMQGEQLVVVQLWPWRRLARTSGCQSTAGGERGETWSTDHEDCPQLAQEMGPRGQDHTYPAGTCEWLLRFDPCCVWPLNPNDCLSSVIWSIPGDAAGQKQNYKEPIAKNLDLGSNI